jgi:hypothetical protein
VLSLGTPASMRLAPSCRDARAGVNRAPGRPDVGDPCRPAFGTDWRRVRSGEATLAGSGRVSLWRQR